MSSAEEARFGMSDVDRLTAIWSVKEAVFKLFSEHHLNFAEQMEVTDLATSPKCLVSFEQKTVEIPFEIYPVNGGVIAYCIEDNS